MMICEWVDEFEGMSEEEIYLTKEELDDLYKERAQAYKDWEDDQIAMIDLED